MLNVGRVQVVEIRQGLLNLILLTTNVVRGYSDLCFLELLAFLLSPNNVVYIIPPALCESFYFDSISRLFLFPYPLSLSLFFYFFFDHFILTNAGPRIYSSSTHLALCLSTCHPNILTFVSCTCITASY